MLFMTHQACEARYTDTPDFDMVSGEGPDDSGGVSRQAPPGAAMSFIQVQYDAAAASQMTGFPCAASVGNDAQGPGPDPHLHARDVRRGSGAMPVGDGGLLGAALSGSPLDPQSAHIHSPAGGPTSKPIRRRMRMITSCLECRRRKLKCNKSQPCHNCTKFGRDCHYLGTKLDEASQLRLNEIKEKVGSLERQLERDVVRSSSRGARRRRIVADEVGSDYSDEGELEPSSLVSSDLTYDDEDGVGAEEFIDLGIQVGRMRITERIGGLNRPRISEELQTDLAAAPSMNAFFEGGVFEGTGQGSEASIPDFLRPGSAYIAPTSGFFFGQVMGTPDLTDLILFKDQSDNLMLRYLDAVHPIARCVHRPTLESQYAIFWEEVQHGYEPRASIQALVFAAWFSAAISLDDARAHREYNVSKAQLVNKMKIGIESALSKANFLRTTKVETLQAFVMYMLPLCREEVSRAHSVLVGAAVRMAECMGLHRDGKAYGLNPLETHVRRLIWHQLCFLDIRTCEAQGPKPAIRREDYDTELPLNIEEYELSPNASSQPKPAEHWTSTLFTVVRFEINEMMRIIWADRRKLEKHKITLSAVLTKIENFRRRIVEKYAHFLDDRVPIQRYAKVVMDLLMYRLHAMVLHPFHANTANPMPDKLRSILIESGIRIIELCMQLEMQPLFKDWAWYLGAYNQFQMALLLATELLYRPDNREVDRIWDCLDWVFILDPHLPRAQKIHQVLTDIMSKSSKYMRLRKIRAPVALAEAVPEPQATKDSSPAPTPRLQLPPGGFHRSAMHPPYTPSAHPHYGMLPGLKMEPGLPPSIAMMPIHQPGPPMPISMAPVPSHPAMHNMVFSGASNGEALWGLPPGNPASPEASSDGGSVAGLGHGIRSMTQATHENVMENIDWDAINAIFPRNPLTGEISFNGFIDPVMGL